MKDEDSSLENRLLELEGLFKREDERLRVGEQVWPPAVIRFTDEMEERYGKECTRAKLWHVILRSTPVEEFNPNFDLPEGEIEYFIRNVLPGLEPEEDDE
jgi:hypothetical protein